MSLLDCNTDFVSQDELILNGIRTILGNNLNKVFNLKDPDINIKIELDDYDVDREYYLGFDYLNIYGKKSLNIKFFDIRYIVPMKHIDRHFQDPNKLWRWVFNSPINVCTSNYYRVGNYSILGDYDIFGQFHDWGWVKVKISDLIECNGEYNVVRTIHHA